MLSRAEVLVRQIERRRSRLIPALREPVREARLAPIDRIHPGLLLLCGLAGSTAVHVLLLAGASGSRRHGEIAPAKRADIKVTVVERPPPPPPPELALQGEAPAPSPRKRMARTAATTAPPPAVPTPPPETAPPEAPSEAPQASNAPPLLMPGVSLSATTAVGGLPVRTGSGGGSRGAPRTPGETAEGAEPGGGKETVPGYMLTEQPVFLDNVSAAEMQKYYPEEARKAQIEGAVRLKLRVDAEGAVTRATVVTDPSGIFSHAAVKVALIYRFRPAKINNRRVATEIEFTIHFELE